MTNPAVVEIGRRPLRSADVAAIADSSVEVRVAPEAVERATASHAYAEEATRTQQVYGRTTGLGANRRTPVDDLSAHAINVLRSHATSAGRLRSDRRIRATLAVRLNQLGAGGSGVTPVAMSGLAEMLNRNSLPALRDFGSIGTGDLSALAVTALALCGDVALSPPLPPHLISPAQDLISVINSNAATVADAALACADIDSISAAAVGVAALTFTAVRGNPQAFDVVVEQSSPLPGVAEVCAQMRSYIGSEHAPARVQDPFALRALPQVHGSLQAALANLDDVVSAVANAPSENPLFVPGFPVAHQGGFFVAHLAQALDTLLSSMAKVAHQSLARLALLMNPAYTEHAPFLAAGPAGSSGLMILEYIAGSAVIRLRALASPAALHTVNLSLGAEEDASSASQAACQALEAVEAFEVVVACELLAAVRALRLSGVEPAGPFDAISRQVTDADLTADLAAARAALPHLGGPT